jgi:ATP-dependent phosphofructokinase / diphosphate-dependent phosphofructokinase
MLIEVMGRDAGWIALHAGLGGGAHIILVPEIPFQFEAICHAVRAR